MEKISALYNDNLEKLKNDFKDCSDFNLKEIYFSERRALVCIFDGLVSSLALSQLVTTPLLTYKGECDDAIKCAKMQVLRGVELNECEDFEKAYMLLMSGFALVIIDGCNKALAVGIQGFEKRGITEPSNESNVKGAKEAFTECLNDSKAMLRRRLKTPRLKLKQFELGKSAPTPVVIAYINDRADFALVTEVEKRLWLSHLDTLADYGELIPFLDSDTPSFFSCTGTTERPDVLASKLLEGRVAVMIDGSPFALFVPSLFSDNFQSPDDYDEPPFYAGFIRLIKYFCFVLAVFLPAFYVAIGTFHQELMPTNLLFTISAEEINTPFSLTSEAILLLLFYEIMREAGLRLPKTIGHAVSIIGGIIIGETSVEAGLIGAPMLVVIAMTAIASYVVYPLYESMCVLRFIFIIVGSISGLYGIMLFAGALFVNISALNSYGVSLSFPISPLDKRAQGDIFFRESWKRLSRHRIRINELRGAATDAGTEK